MDTQTAVPASTPTTDLPSIIRKHKYQNTQLSTMEMLEAGRALIAIKAAVPHGEFLNKLQELKVSRCSASRIIAATNKFGSGTLLHALTVIGKTKLFELLPFEDEELYVLLDGGTLFGMDLSAIQTMTIKQLRVSLKQAKNEVIARFEDKNAVLDQFADKFAVERNFDQNQPIQPSDRIRNQAKTCVETRFEQAPSTMAEGKTLVDERFDEISPEKTADVSSYTSETPVNTGSGDVKISDVGDLSGQTQANPRQGDAKTSDVTDFPQESLSKGANVYHLGDYAQPKTADRSAVCGPQSQQIRDESADGQHFERRKAYCRDLCRVLLRHADGVEAETFIRSVEESIARITSRRYAPGLNAAAYDMYARHMLKGGVQ